MLNLLALGLPLTGIAVIVALVRWGLTKARAGSPQASRSAEIAAKILRQPFVALVIFAFGCAGVSYLYDTLPSKWTAWKRSPEMPEGTWDVVESRGCGNTLSKASFRFNSASDGSPGIQIVGPQWPPSKERIADTQKKWGGRLLLKLESGRELLWEMDTASHWICLKWESLGQERQVTLRPSLRQSIPWQSYEPMRSAGL